MAVELARWDDLLQGDELAHVTTEPAREAQLTPFPDDLHPLVRDALPHEALFAHQRETWDAARRGEHVVVTTGTASGKTLAFNLPVLDAIARDPKLRTLYLYPTGARAGSGAQPRRVQATAHARGDLRRRHAGRAPLADPPLGEPHPHEPGHAPRRHPPAP